jgi:hypothetical protein
MNNSSGMNYGVNQLHPHNNGPTMTQSSYYEGISLINSDSGSGIKTTVRIRGKHNQVIST